MTNARRTTELLGETSPRKGCLCPGSLKSPQDTLGQNGMGIFADDFHRAYLSVRRVCHEPTKRHIEATICAPEKAIKAAEPVSFLCLLCYSSLVHCRYPAFESSPRTCFHQCKQQPVLMTFRDSIACLCHCNFFAYCFFSSLTSFLLVSKTTR